MERLRELAIRGLLVVAAGVVMIVVVGWQRDAERCEKAAEMVANARGPALERDLDTLTGNCGGSEEPLAATALLLQARRGNEAARLARELVRDEPENYHTWLTLAAALRSGDPAASRRALARARELNPRYRPGSS